MKWINIALLVLVAYFQIRLWYGEGGLAELDRVEQQIALQRQENSQLEARNDKLRIEVKALKHGLDSVEARARRDLGMIRKGETFFLVATP